jgi:acetyl esterase
MLAVNAEKLHNPSGVRKMTSIRTQNQAIEVEDIEYLRHGDAPLLARVFKPRGTGPFPGVVQLHGGAWCLMDRTRDNPLNEALAHSGVVVAAIDFRMPPQASYPASMQDINYAIRWLKMRASEFGTRPEMVGVAGTSSGGHQAMLTAMRPRDPRYSAIPSPAGARGVDAIVKFVAMCWPVIDPLSRYRYAQRLKAGGKPYPEFVDNVLPLHDAYWKTEDAMAEGNPLQALERGEKVELPPALYLQGENDIVHPRADLERFIADYRKAGGKIELELIEGASEAFISRDPSSPQSRRAIAKIIEFVHRTAQ